MWTASALNPAESRSVPGWTPVVRRDSERSASISALNMKAMAMRLRHKVHDVNRRRAESKESSLSAPGSLSLARPLEADQLMPVEETRDGSKASNGRGLQTLDEKEGPNNAEGLKSILVHPFSILLIFMPLGGIAFWYQWGSAYCFWLNLLAMVPLAKILGDGTEELAAALKNDTLSGLLNATLGNVVEMILSIQTLRKGLIPVVKATLLGSILSNILLVLGTSFFFGGIIKGSQVGAFHVIHSEDDREGCCSLTLEKEQIFSVKAALINVAMQLLACMTCVLPTVFYSSQGEHSEKDQAVILEVSRVGACIIATSYVAYVFFQLITHKNMLAKDEHVHGDDDDDDADEPGLTVFCSLAVMVVSTGCIAICSELLVHSIEEVVEHTSLNQNLIGVVLLPFAGNACEHASAVRFAIQDRPGLSIGIAVGSSTQIALCVVPFAVIMGWILNEPMDLNFGPMNTAVMLLSVLVTQVLVMDGRANWLKGFMLCTAYFFISALYWYFPGEI